MEYYKIVFIEKAMLQQRTKEVFRLEVGEKLAKLRKERNLGQKELAAILNLSTGTISNYENGVHSPDLNTLCKLAEFFGVTTDYLLNRTNYRYNPKKMSQRLSRDYTLSDVVDVVLSCNESSVDHLMEYALFLRARQEKRDAAHSQD